MIENTNTKQFYPGPILNNTLEITDFLFNDAAQIKVTYSKFNEEQILVDVDLNYGTDYEVTKVLPSDINVAEAALTASTGQVIIKNINVLDGEKLTVYRLSELIQDKDYPRTGAFPAATHEGALDYLTMQNQEQQEELSRALKVPISTGEFNAAVPVPLPNRILRIDENATGFEFVPYDLDERLDTFEDTIENTLETNKSELETSFNNFKLETEEILANNKTELEGIIEDNKQEVLSIQSDYQEEMDSKFQTVSDAADKINELESAVDTAVAAADTAVAAADNAVAAADNATEQANLAIDSVQNIETTSSQLKEEIIQEAEKQIENIQSTGLGEISEALNNKVDLDAKNYRGSELEEYVNDTCLNDKRTNCLTKIPQRIKHTLADGTLTILAGSVTIFPYGTEDLTEQLPIGSTFLNDNLKVVDTCWDGSKFFVWAELQSGFPRKSTYNATDFIYLDRNGSNLRTPTNTACSGSTADTTLGAYIFWYDTTNNYVKFSTDNGATWNTNNSLPLVIVQGNSTTGYTSIQHTFNGWGYIGSTIWLDKGIKGLIPNGRNEDGSLNNIERITPNIITRTLTTQNGNIYAGTNLANAIGLYVPTNFNYDYKNNLNTNNQIIFADITATNGVISNFQPKQPFRAVDYNDFNSTPHIVETYKSGNSWYRVWSDGWIEQGGLQAFSQYTSYQISLLKSYKDASYHVQATVRAKDLNTGKYYSGGYLSGQQTTTKFALGWFHGAANTVDRQIYWYTCGY